MITNQIHAQKLMNKAKFTSAEGCVCDSNLSQASWLTHCAQEGVCRSVPYPDGQVWIHSLSDWLRLRFRGAHRGRTDMIGDYGQKLNLTGVLKDKEVTHKVRILEFLGN
jgi:hypothetical protein